MCFVLCVYDGIDWGWWGLVGEECFCDVGEVV